LNIWRQAIDNMRTSRDMPAALRGITAVGMLVSVAGVIAVTTVSLIWRIGSQTTPFRYMWRSGAWVSFYLWLLLIFVGCLGVAARRSSFRWILVISPFVIEALSIPNVGLRLFDIASAAFWGLSSYAYLFHAISVRRYFAVAHP
jgi:hypothetical protein